MTQDTDIRAALTVPNFIVDAAATDDELSSHLPIAQAIAEVVRQNEKVRIIGVIGAWGSGKSTVVKLTQRDIAAKGDKIACYTFDAWQHQSDPHRRAFLDRLLNFIEVTEGYDRLKTRIPAWRKNLDTLNKLRDEVTTETTPQLNLGSVIFALSILLLPLGIRLIGTGSLPSEALTDLNALFMFRLGWALSLAPLAVAAVLGILQILGLMETSVFSIIAGKAYDSRREVKLKTEPTSDDFRTAFRAFVREAQAVGPRLVVIVDNLDRLPPEDALTIWSTVRSLFLSEDGSREEEKDEKAKDLPTLIMPIDQGAIEAIYADTAGPNSDLARSFIDKTFDIVFHVPKPVTSRRDSYLIKRLTEVFGSDIDDHTLHDVNAVFDKHSPNAAEGSPSPRVINAFVNSVAVLWMQRQSPRIPIPLIAYFVLKKHEIGDQVREWVTAHPEDLAAFGAFSHNQLAALKYGVPVDAAQELYLDEPMRNAIDARQSGRFEELAAVPGFTASFLSNLERAIAQTGFLNAMAAADMLAANSRAGVWVSESWNRLRTLAIRDLPEFPIEAPEVSGLKAIVDASTAEQRILFLQQLKLSLNAGSGRVVGHDGGKAYAALTVYLLDAARDAGISDFLVPVPGGVAPFFIMMLQGLPVETTRALELRPAVESKIIEELASYLEDAGKIFTVRPLIVALSERDPAFDFSSLNGTLHAELVSGDTRNIQVAAGVMFDLVSRPGPERDALVTRGTDGNIENAFLSNWQEADDQSIAETAALVLLAGGRLQISGEQTWQTKLASAHDLIERIDKAATQLGINPNIDWLTERLRAFSDDDVLIRNWAVHRLLAEDISTDEIFQRQTAINWLLPEHMRALFWTRIATKPGFSAFIRRIPLSDAGLILAAVENSQSNKRTRALLPALLARQSSVVWLAALESGVEPFGMVHRLEEGTLTENAGRHAYEALLETSQRALETPDSSFGERWFAVFDRLSPGDRDRLTGQLADALMRTSLDAQRLLGIISRAGPRFVTSPAFAQQPDRVVQEILLPILSDERGRFWALANVDLVRSWLRRSASATRDTFLDHLGSYVSNGYSLATELLRTFEGR